MTRIALFGTSADPPTAGHQTILAWLSQQYDLVVVWASDNPFKEHQTTLQQRTEMLQLAIKEIHSPKHNILLRSDLSDRRTLVTVNKAKKIWGDQAEFTLVIGSDLVHQITSWYHVEELLAQVKVLVMPRPGYSVTEADLEEIRNLGGNCAIASFYPPEASSTAYRQERNERVITPAIKKYINQKRLYDSSENSSMAS